ncbi:MAG: FHA domain-containing protein [Actinobacteria bacterium]|nr:FHA domain-containing protein [Actinomycetota bacterium]
MNCPHDRCAGSVMSDGFCDTCGRRPTTSMRYMPAPDPVAAAAASPDPPCPSCGAARDLDALFCEACGFDFVNSKPPSMPVARPSSTDEVPMKGAEPPAAAAGAETVEREPVAAAAWEATVQSDASWYAKFCETWKSTHGAECPVAFPGELERVEPVEGPVVVIGRHATGIDLALDPNDAAVSHRHASLIRQPDGTYALTDLDSSNGTYIDDKPVAKGQTAMMSDGDSFTVGAFTRITLRLR